MTKFLKRRMKSHFCGQILTKNPNNSLLSIFFSTSHRQLMFYSRQVRYFLFHFILQCLLKAKSL